MTRRASAASSRFSAARSTSRPGDRHRPLGHAGRDRQSSRAARGDRRGLPQPDQARLVAATPTASTTSRASTRRCSRSIRAGPHRPQQLPERRGRDRHLRTDQAQQGARRPRRRTATSSAPDNFFLEMQYQGIDEQRIVNTGLLPIARELNLPLVCTNDVHYLRQTDQHPHDVLLCIGTGKSVSDEKRLKYHGDQFFLKTARRDGDGLRRLSRTRCRTPCASPSAATSRCPKGEAHLPNFQVPPGYTLESYFEHVVREGFARAHAATASARSGAASCDGRSPTTRRDSTYEIDMIRRMKYSGLLPDRLGLHPVRARAAAFRSDPAAGRPPAAWSRTACGSPTSIRSTSTCYFERFLNPERVVAARYRHRLLRAPARRSHQLRHARSTAARTSRRSSRSER